MPHPGVPVSLVDAPTAADRRVIAGRTTTNGAPSGPTAGFNTQGRRWVHASLKLNDAATDIEWRLWVYDRASGDWRRFSDTDEALAESDADHPKWKPFDIMGAERVYIELVTMNGVYTNGVDVWLSATGAVEAG